MTGLQSIRGMRDLLPEETPRWQLVEQTLQRVVLGYGYEEIRLPLLEPTELFARGVGESTDIVEKEMYTFADRDGDSLTLRPEGTASCARALIQHGLLFNQAQRVWYSGPMFRHERPQKGRYRQFYQLGVEAFGLSGPDVEAELLVMSQRFWQALGVQDQVRLELNTLGSPDVRARYAAALVDFLRPHADALDEDSRRRLDRNPLRILDSKVEATQALLAEAPRLAEFLDDASRRHFDDLRSMLADLGVPFRINERLVRGLDYYAHTVFEWVTEALGSQGAVCAGGRYDGLVTQLGGRPAPAAGFAVGIDRIVLLHEVVQAEPPQAPVDLYLCAFGEPAAQVARSMAEALRSALPTLRVRLHLGGGKPKAQLKRADHSGARWAGIIGESEAAQQQLTLKPLRGEGEQQTLDIQTAIAHLRAAGS